MKNEHDAHLALLDACSSRRVYRQHAQHTSSRAERETARSVLLAVLIGLTLAVLLFFKL